MIAFTPYLSWLAAALCVGAAWLAAPWLNRAARSPGQPPHPWEPATAPALALMGMLISLGWPLPEGWPPGNLWPLTQPLLYGWTGYLIAVVDLREMEVDLRFVTAGILLRLAWLLVFPISGNLVDMVGGMLMGAGGLYWVGVMYQALRGRQGLGDGDAAVLGLVGAFTGWQPLPLVVSGAAGLGLGWAAWQMARGRWESDRPIPFAPCLLAAGGLVYVWMNTQQDAPWGIPL